MELFEQDFYRVESNNIRVDFPAFFAGGGSQGRTDAQGAARCHPGHAGG